MAATDSGPERTRRELRDMDEQTARNSLTVAEFERWERIQDLYEQREDTLEEWDDQEQTVADVTVHADAETLGTDINLYGNDLLVRVRPGSRRLQQVRGRLDDNDINLDNPDADDVDDIDEETQAAITDALTTLLDAILVRWNGTDWRDLPGHEREAILDEARQAWGLDGLLFGVVQIIRAVHEDQNRRVEDVKSFLGEAGAGDY